MSYELDKALKKLEKMQSSNGGFPWFTGMEDDRYISDILKKYPLLPDILNTIEAKKNGGEYIYLLHPKGKRFEEEYPHELKYGDKKYPFAVFITNETFYDTILTNLRIAKITLQKYLRSFCKVGILKKLPNTGKYKNIPIYAVGYFGKWEDTYKLNRFLTSDNKEALRKFTI